MRIAFFSIALPLVISGCSAPSGDYPSLLPRPIEKVGFAEPERAAPETQADAALEIGIDQQRRALDAAIARFDTAAASAERAARAARGAPAGSEAWLDAQIALAELDTLRQDGAAVLGDIEKLAIDRAVEGKPAYPPLTRLQGDAEARARTEGERIARIAAMLAPA